MMRVIHNKNSNNILLTLKRIQKAAFYNTNAQSINILLNNIHKLYKLFKGEVSIKDIIDGIKKVCPALPVDIYPVEPKIHYLYRVRMLKTSTKNKLNLLDDWHKSDSWAAPSSYTPSGRLNRKGQVLLYLSFEPKVALAEKGATKGDIAACSCFEVINPFKLVDLEFTNSINYIRNQSKSFKKRFKVAITALIEYQLFLKKEFSQKGNNHVYKITTTIGQDIYKPKLFGANGWFYPSVKLPFNSSRDDDICLRTKCAEKCLKLVNVKALQVGKDYKIIDGCNIKIN